MTGGEKHCTESEGAGMKEYIERAAVIDLITRRYELPELCTHEINSIPAADVVEVRHGRWLTTDAYPHHLYCSVCYKTYAKNAKWVNELDLPTNYCPNCGALMREIENGEK